MWCACAFLCERLINIGDINHADATSATADKMIQEFKLTLDNQMNLQHYGRLLDRLVQLFYCSTDRRSMLCTLYNRYRRWELHHRQATDSQITLLKSVITLYSASESIGKLTFCLIDYQFIMHLKYFLHFWYYAWRLVQRLLKKIIRLAFRNEVNP